MRDLAYSRVAVPFRTLTLSGRTSFRPRLFPWADPPAEVVGDASAGPAPEAGFPSPPQVRSSWLALPLLRFSKGARLIGISRGSRVWVACFPVVFSRLPPPSLRSFRANAVASRADHRRCSLLHFPTLGCSRLPCPLPRRRLFSAQR